MKPIELQIIAEERLRAAGLEGVVTAQAVEHRGAHAVLLFADVCAEHAADPRRVLAAAAFMGAGAVVLLAGRYVVRYTVTDAEVRSSTLVAAARYASAISVELRTRLHSERQAFAAKLFSHYANEESMQ